MQALALLISLLFCASAFAGEAKTVRILTIGNSFSRNATNHLDDLALAGGHTLIHTPLVIGGASFQVHVDKAKMEAKTRHHANLAGEYLGACVWYEILFGESAVGNRYVPKGFDAEYARFLQETAHKSVQARGR